MSRHPSGTVCWVRDPTEAHADRPAVILAHDTHPFGATDCTIMCIGTSANKYQNQYTPEVKDTHLRGISLSKDSYFMPWALYTIPPGAIRQGKPIGKLTAAGEKEVKKALISNI